jgi:hypothetical protein
MLGQYLYLEIKNAMLKLEIGNIIVIYLVDEEILNEDVLDLEDTVSSFSFDSLSCSNSILFNF